jgi:hypothetical protein
MDSGSTRDEIQRRTGVRSFRISTLNSSSRAPIGLCTPRPLLYGDNALPGAYSLDSPVLAAVRAPAAMAQRDKQTRRTKKTVILWLLQVAVLASIFGAARVLAQNQPSAEQVNEANNPLTPKITAGAQDQWAPTLYDTDADTNAFLLRGVMPHLLFGSPQVLRATLPTVTSPDVTGSNVTGLGDLNLLDIFVFKEPGFALGVGPQFTLPTATNDALGTGKWQAGFAGVAIAPLKWGLLGGLVTWQHSFAGNSDRVTQNNLAAQPVVIYNLADGVYLRSTATWNFDLVHNQYVIPVGAGVGKVWLLSSGTSVNAFAEPQWTVAHDGAGQPQFQVFAGVNFQFPIHK